MLSKLACLTPRRSIQLLVLDPDGNGIDLYCPPEVRQQRHARQPVS